MMEQTEAIAQTGPLDFLISSESFNQGPFKDDAKLICLRLVHRPGADHRYGNTERAHLSEPHKGSALYRWWIASRVWNSSICALFGIYQGGSERMIDLSHLRKGSISCASLLGWHFYSGTPDQRLKAAEHPSVRREMPDCSPDERTARRLAIFEPWPMVLSRSEFCPLFAGRSPNGHASFPRVQMHYVQLQQENDKSLMHTVFAIDGSSLVASPKRTEPTLERCIELLFTQEDSLVFGDAFEMYSPAVKDSSALQMTFLHQNRYLLEDGQYISS